MIARKLRAAVLALGATLGLSACTYGDGYYGGSAYSVGLGYYDDYGSPWYGRYGYGYGPGYGWYDGWYYPGSGYYVYDRGGRRQAWNRSQRDYWRARARTPDDRREIRRNFREYRADRQTDRAAGRAARQANREALRAGTIDRQQFRQQRLENRRAFRQERGDDRRQLRRENRRAIRN